MNMHRGILGALLGAAALTVIPATAHANQTERKTFDVHFEYTEPISGVDGAQCRGVATNKPTCSLVFVGPVHFRGAVAGDAYYEVFGPGADGSQYTGANHFDHAVVDGCGEGALDLEDLAGDMVRPTGADPKTASTEGYNKWHIGPGGGPRNGIPAIVNGEGENVWRQYWSDANGQAWGRGVFTGTITCDLTKRPTQPVARQAPQVAPSPTHGDGGGAAGVRGPAAPAAGRVRAAAGDPGAVVLASSTARPDPIVSTATTAQTARLADTGVRVGLLALAGALVAVLGVVAVRVGTRSGSSRLIPGKFREILRLFLFTST